MLLISISLAQQIKVLQCADVMDNKSGGDKKAIKLTRALQNKQIFSTYFSNEKRAE